MYNPPLLDPENILKFQPVGDDYLTYLYLEPSDNRLDQMYLTAAANAGDGMKQKPQVDEEEEDIIIGAPSMNFDPYLSRGLVFNSGPVHEQNLKKENHPFRPLIQGRNEIKVNDDLSKLMEDDWIPIPSPWEKYKTNLEVTTPAGTKCDAANEKCWFFKQDLVFFSFETFLKNTIV